MTRYPSARNAYYFVSVYLLLIFVFTLYRALLVAVEFSSFSSIPGNAALLVKAFSIGWRFDTVIACYILSLPVVALSFCSFVRINNTRVYRVISAFIVILCLAAFFVAAADIPYFRHFSTRISAAVLNWKDNPLFVTLMILREPKFMVYMLVFLVSAATFVIFHRRIRNRAFPDLSGNPGMYKRYYIDLVISSILMLGLVFLGARGRIDRKSPIKPSAASFSDYPLLNQVALNPDYTFMVSYLDGQKKENRELHLMRDDLALNNSLRSFRISRIVDGSPVARQVSPARSPLRANVVLVIMESMSGRFMGHFGNTQNLTPNLDSLADRSLFFDRMYSSGYHTSAGVYASLFSYPNLLNHHPLNEAIIPEYTGIANTLRHEGHQTVYFTTHDPMFDNIGGFLRSNGFERIISEQDYPSSEVKSTLGVPDHFMFYHAITVLNELHAKGRPFLGVLLTASNHDPHIIPEEAAGFKPHTRHSGTQIVEYADWAIGRFLKQASLQPWFDSTIFVFIADHGARVEASAYDLSLQYFNVPMMIYSPLLVKPGRCSKIAQQVDLFPTLMGIMNIPYVNNTFGIDLAKETRPYAYFCADEEIGCVGEEFYLVHRMNGPETLYRFKNEEKRNYAGVYPALADSMRNYAFSMLQSAQWMVKNRKTGFPR